MHERTSASVISRKQCGHVETPAPMRQQLRYIIGAVELLACRLWTLQEHGNLEYKTVNDCWQVCLQCRLYNETAEANLTIPQLARSQARRVLDGMCAEKGPQDPEQHNSQEGAQKLAGQHQDYVVVAEIGPGQAFGEHAFFTGKRCWATVVARSCCQAQTVNVGPFCRVLHEWPDIRHDIMVHATQLSKVAENELEQQEKEKLQDQLQRTASWQAQAYGDEFDPREQEFRL